MIAQSLIDSGVISSRYMLLLWITPNVSEKQSLVTARLREQATVVKFIDDSASVPGKLAGLVPIFLNLARRGGKLYSSSLLNLSLAIALKLVPQCCFYTFDEGGFNISKKGPYFSLPSLKGNWLKLSLINRLFPRGVLSFLTERSLGHYTIFSRDVENVVEPKRLKSVHIPWSEYLLPQDRETLTNFEASKVVLGTAFQNFANGKELAGICAKLVQESDLFLAHPGDRYYQDDFSGPDLKSPAEAIITFLANKSEHLTVYHFSSTVSLNLHDLKQVQFVDVLAGEPSDG